IPYLETYNPQVKQLLWRMADGLGLDEEVLDKTVNEALVGCNFNREKGWVRLNRKAFLQLLTGLQQRIIRQAVFYLQEDLRDIDYLAVKRAIDFLNNPTSTNRIDLMAGLLVQAEEDDFYIAYWNATLPLDNFPQIDHEMDVRKVRSYPLTNNWEMRLEVVKRPDLKQVRTNRDPFACWLDLEKITFPIIVRGYRAGERFTPMGMAGHSLKVSDYFTNNKVPRRARNQLPILVEREEILWLTHGPPAEGRGVTESTRRALKIFYSQKEITKKPK
ncbi:MAG: tRNA lysidine(34) synthetase TilS, partial [Anaerolineales bacterium]|nr:tRNA lysidine(34) synthetase TilS [Anaerolineales bacterium]